MVDRRGLVAVSRWTVGGATITSVVEADIANIPPELFFPTASAAEVAGHDWVVPDFATADGMVSLRVQALVVEVGPRTVLVDPCVGDDKSRALWFWNQQHWGWLDRFVDAGFDPDRVDTVVHTHLHADHVGWDTRPDGDRWIPTFPNARHLYTAAEVEHWKAEEQRTDEDVWADSVEPIFAAGLADLVAVDADLGDGLRLVPTVGHTPGHTSLWIESDGARGVITGDLIHHPVQCAEPQWNEIGDVDLVQAEATRLAFLQAVADDDVLVFGTHFPTRPAGHVKADGRAFRFFPA
jgi:glyoxylase-like metal-dependent hydrolase (beta-lactamase superfamily II)